MELFKRFCNKAPQQLTREDVLAFRDFLAAGYEGKKPPAAGTLANKIGFVGTLVNSGRNHAKYASHLPNNPFENIKVKRARRGKAGERRLPFTDAELKRNYILDKCSFSARMNKRQEKCHGKRNPHSSPIQ